MKSDVADYSTVALTFIQTSQMLHTL